MPPERTKQLVYELDAWYRASRMRQKDLASELGLSPQQLSEIISLRNNPTSEQILTIQDFLKDQVMSTHLYEPKPDRPPRVQDPNNPLTLNAAKERIEELNAELQQLKGTKAAPPRAATPTPPATPPRSAAQAPAAAKPAAPMSSTAMIINPRPAPTTELERLRSALEAAPAGERGELYKRIKELERDSSALRAFKRSR